MATSQTEIQSQVIALSSDASEAFCEDISGMFDINMESQHGDVRIETASCLSKKFKKVAAIISVRATGILDGVFRIIFDKEGLFTLGGTIVMQPEPKILESRKRGSIDDAKNLSDAFGEIGNLFVGSWDRIFRENIKEHGHFVQHGTFLGEPWSDSKQTIGLAESEEFLFVPCKMTVGQYPAFEYGIIFPKTIFEKPSIPVPEAAESVDTPLAIEEPIKQEDVANQVLPQENETDIPSQSLQADEVTIPEAIQKMIQSHASLSGSQQMMSLSMTAKDIMQSETIWADPEDNVQQALKLIEQHNSDYIMVGKNNTIDGIISIRDVNSAVSIYLRPMFVKWRRPTDDATLQIKLKWIMSKLVHTVTPETPLIGIMEKMFQINCKCLPVVDSQGKLHGLITALDVFAAMISLNSNIALNKPTTAA